MADEEFNETQEWTREVETVQAHYSSISLHRKCPQAWYFRYGLGLNRPEYGPKPYLEYGSWFGAMRTAEALERGRRMGSLIVKPRKFSPVDDWEAFDMATVTPREVLQSAVTWWKAQLTNGDATEVQDAWHSALGAPLPNRLRDGFVRWRDEWGEAAKRERPLALEMFWKRALPRSSNDLEWETAGLGELPEMRLIGFIDELYEDTERNMIVVRDNKTTSQMPTQSSLDDMLNSQLQFYVWGVTPKLHELGLLPPRAVSYDRALSKQSPRPKLNQNGSLSATVKNFDLRTYREWVAEGQDYPGRAKDGSGAGTYLEDPEVVARLSSPTHKSMFHQRTFTPVNRQIVAAHLRAAVDTVTDIWRTTKRAEIAYEAARNMGDGCKWCSYVELCRSTMFGGADGEYDIREAGLRSSSGKFILAQGKLQ